jgi:signal transduction histidine kinase
VFETGRPVRVDSYADSASGPLGVTSSREMGMRSAVATPIIVEGRLWGVMGAGSTLEEPLPPDAEARLASFTELVATAIANADSRAELIASRTRIIAAADDTRRRIECDLHDGTQQQLVSLILDLRQVEAAVPPQLADLEGGLARIAGRLQGVLDQVREISRGIHPAILSEGGLTPALRVLARRSRCRSSSIFGPRGGCPNTSRSRRTTRYRRHSGVGRSPQRCHGQSGHPNRNPLCHVIGYEGH